MKVLGDNPDNETHEMMRKKFECFIWSAWAKSVSDSVHQATIESWIVDNFAAKAKYSGCVSQQFRMELLDACMDAEHISSEVRFEIQSSIMNDVKSTVASLHCDSKLCFTYLQAFPGSSCSTQGSTSRE